MESMGLSEKKPVSKKHLAFEELDLKSKRIINRLNFYMKENQVGVQDIFYDLVMQQQVKTKSRSEKVDLIKSVDFFQRLSDMELKKSSNQHENLMLFLCIDKSYKNNLMLKKLSRTLQEFTESPYMNSTGCRKRKLDRHVIQTIVAAVKSQPKREDSEVESVIIDSTQNLREEERKEDGSKEELGRQQQEDTPIFMGQPERKEQIEEEKEVGQQNPINDGVANTSKQNLFEDDEYKDEYF